MGQMLAANDPESIQRAANTIRAGGLVAFPTETVYGLGCDAMNRDAVAKIFEVKHRPEFDPLILHIADRAMLDVIVSSRLSIAEKLMDVFWPGPLTLVLPKTQAVPDLVTAGLDSVAVRMPSHAVAQTFIRAAGTPVAAPSANPFGYVSPTTAQHVWAGLGDKVDLILDGGSCPVGVESTILSLLGPQPELLRPGSITIEELGAVIGSIERPSGRDKQIAPGQSARHYATRTPLTILATQGDRPPIARDERAGLLAFSAIGDREPLYSAYEVLSSTGDLREAACRLFAALRRLDSLGLDRIYAEPCEDRGLGLAIMDRLKRCAAQ